MNYVENRYCYHAGYAMDWLENIDTVKKLLEASDYLEEVHKMYMLMVSELEDALVRFWRGDENGDVVFLIQGKEYVCTEDTPVYRDSVTKSEFSFIVRHRNNGKVGDATIFYVRLMAGVDIDKVLAEGYKEALSDAELVKKVEEINKKEEK